METVKVHKIPVTRELCVKGREAGSIKRFLECPIVGKQCYQCGYRGCKYWLKSVKLPSDGELNCYCMAKKEDEPLDWMIVRRGLQKGARRDRSWAEKTIRDLKI